MPRPATGTIESHPWKDGRTVTWRIRVPYRGRRFRLTLGTNHEGWNEERAKVELERIIGQIERGTWQPPEAVPLEPEPIAGDETIHVTASRWWQQKQTEPLAPKTRKDILWRLSYILAYKPEAITSQIDALWVDEFKDWLGRQRSTRGRQLQPRSINMVLAQLATVLEKAVDYKILPSNPARGRERRVREGRRRRYWLEPDMVADLLDAAGDWEREVPAHQRYGRRAFLSMLALAGPRISELTGGRRRSLDIHSEVWRIPASKTEAGERDVALTAFVLSELRPHLADVASRVKSEVTPNLPIFPTLSGGELNDSNVRERLIATTVERANEKRAAEGRMLLPESITPHTFRRTFVWLCSRAGRDIRWTMDQVGHSSSKLVLEIYSQAPPRHDADLELVWELMRFSDEPEALGNRPMNRPLSHWLASDPHGRMSTSERIPRSKAV